MSRNIACIPPTRLASLGIVAPLSSARSSTSSATDVVAMRNSVGISPDRSPFDTTSTRLLQPNVA